MNAKLSVIIPVYNGEHHVKHCIDSIQNQSLKDIQIIIVDDGSKDQTVQTVQQCANQAENILLIQQKENKGTGSARNLGLQYAQTEYIAFLDVDDWMDLDGYLEMTSALDTSASDIGICNIYTEYGDYRSSKIRYKYRHSNTITGRFALRLLCKAEAYDNYISPRVGNKVFRRNFLNRHGISFPAQSIWEDDMFSFLAFYHAQNVDLIPTVAEHYFQREFSAMHSFSRNHIDCLIAVLRQLKHALIAEGNGFSCETEYYAFLDRNLNVLFDSIFSNEQNLSVQRSYISYLLEQLLQLFTIRDLVEHIEPKRLSRLWT